ncbi:mitochondrial MICS1-like protein [Andalucia godoyi]|uniref:Mitochondrial MICS1-like protein n=1 Tax=Andalucia godoyi TaxID=505711 RepID=A0A8K0AHB3_ANDGO|nr:mitochondrial MICS1-like protein [Andalucia godoyi]|eukprot:ANDGO_03509.mRNA.1 mitochondrial MICS1 homolog
MLASVFQTRGARLALGVGGLVVAGVSLAAATSAPQRLSTLSTSPFLTGIQSLSPSSSQLLEKDRRAYLAKAASTVLYTSAVAASSAFLLRRATVSLPKILGISAGIISSQIAVHSLDIHTQFPLKIAALSAFGAATGASLMGMRYFASPQMLATAALGTLAVAAGAALTSYVVKDIDRLPGYAALVGGSAAVSLCGLGSMFFPHAVLHNVWLYGGLGVFSVLMMVGMHRIQRNALENPRHADYINDSMHVYVDMYQVFSRLLLLKGGTNRR